MGAFIINIMIFEANVQQKSLGAWIYNLRSLLSLLICLDTDCTEVLFHVFCKVLRYVMIFTCSYAPVHPDKGPVYMSVCITRTYISELCKI